MYCTTQTKSYIQKVMKINVTSHNKIYLKSVFENFDIYSFVDLISFPLNLILLLLSSIYTQPKNYPSDPSDPIIQNLRWF